MHQKDRYVIHQYFSAFDGSDWYGLNKKGEVLGCLCEGAEVIEGRINHQPVEKLFSCILFDKELVAKRLLRGVELAPNAELISKPEWFAIQEMILKLKRI